ncbi:MAG: hypothetical protein ABSE52_07630 [Candidatus Dormibacteria bacterium]
MVHLLRHPCFQPALASRVRSSSGSNEALGRQSPFTERERAALQLTDAITLIGDSHVPRDVFESARGHFEDKELAELIWAVIVINAWNRMAVTARSLPGEYTPG